MTEETRTSAPTVFPALRYRDAAAAIAWLESAFGFEQGLIVADDDGVVAHAELWLGSGAVMLGQLHEGNGDSPPDRQNMYVIVPDADAHHARAQAAGAEIASAPFDTDYGSREYAVRDLDGHLWSFGTYVPNRQEATVSA